MAPMLTCTGRREGMQCVVVQAAAEADAQLAAAAAEAAARAPKPQLSKEEMAAKRREHDPNFSKAKFDKRAPATAAPNSVKPSEPDHKRKSAGEAILLEDDAFCLCVLSVFDWVLFPKCFLSNWYFRISGAFFRASLI